MVAFLFSLILTAAMTWVVVVFARRRPPGTPLTWGEAFIAGTWLFALMFLLYGVVPHQFLAWADSDLAWRSDKIGIPLGPIGPVVEAITPAGWVENNLLAPAGIPLPRGHFIVTALVIRDLLVSGLYVVFLVGQILMWLWWQNRGKKKPVTPELTSAYGRPLVRRV